MEENRKHKWFKAEFLVPIKKTSSFIDYRIATKEELKTAKELLTNMQAVYPEPPNWFSHMKWHPNPTYVDTRTAVGYVRPARRNDPRR